MWMGWTPSDSIADTDATALCRETFPSIDCRGYGRIKLLNGELDLFHDEEANDERRKFANEA